MPDPAPEHGRSDEQLCPACHALLLPGASRCWLCEDKVQPVAADSAAVPPAASQVVRPERLGTYSLASLMMFVTLMSVVLGVSTIAPGVGIPLGIVALLAFVRTAVLIRRQRTLGHRPHTGERAILFAASLAVVILAGIAAAIAFYTTCWGGIAVSTLLEPSGYGDVVFWGGILLGIIVGSYVCYRVLIWPSKSGSEANLSGPSRLMIMVAATVLAIVAAGMVVVLILSGLRS